MSVTNANGWSPANLEDFNDAEGSADLDFTTFSVPSKTREFIVLDPDLPYRERATLLAVGFADGYSDDRVQEVMRDYIGTTLRRQDGSDHPPGKKFLVLEIHPEKDGKEVVL